LHSTGFLDKLKIYLSDDRLKHSIGVRDTAVKLSEIYGCNKEKAEIASFLHDIARDVPLNRMQEIIKKHDLSIEDYAFIKNNPLLLHAYVGKIMAQKDFGIQDEEILRSIELHTTGGNSMSLFCKVIFVADYIEPMRKFRGVKKARKLAFKDIDIVVLYIYKSTIRHLLKCNYYIHKNTLNGYNELIQKYVS